MLIYERREKLDDLNCSLPQQQDHVPPDTFTPHSQPDSHLQAVFLINIHTSCRALLIPPFLTVLTQIVQRNFFPYHPFARQNVPK